MGRVEQQAVAAVPGLEPVHRLLGAAEAVGAAVAGGAGLYEPVAQPGPGAGGEASSSSTGQVRLAVLNSWGPSPNLPVSLFLIFNPGLPSQMCINVIFCRV